MKSGLISLLENFGNPFKAQTKFPFNYNLPECYPKVEKAKPEIVKNFKESTLIYIFYNIIDKEAQKNAALRLYDKGWKYEPKMKSWFCESEDGRYKEDFVFFDVNNWKVAASPVKKSKCCFVDRGDFLKA